MESAPACEINIDCTVGAEFISARYPNTRLSSFFSNLINTEVRIDMF